MHLTLQDMGMSPGTGITKPTAHMCVLPASHPGIDLARLELELDRYNTLVAAINHLADEQKTQVSAMADAADCGEEWRAFELRNTARDGHVDRLTRYLNDQRSPLPRLEDDTRELQSYRQVLDQDCV